MLLTTSRISSLLSFSSAGFATEYVLVVVSPLAVLLTLRLLLLGACLLALRLTLLLLAHGAGLLCVTQWSAMLQCWCAKIE